MAVPPNVGKSRNPSSAYTPKFKNPVPIPAIDEFRLNNILANSLHDQAEVVSQSLLNVNAKYQTDLRTEIRRALTIEQKIQYKNIQVSKLAYSIQKGLDHRRRRFNRIPLRKSNLKTQSASSGSLSDVDKLLDLAIKTSASVQSLSVRLASIDRKGGGSGCPDPAKYPKLAKLLAQLDPSVIAASNMDEFEVYSTSLEEPQLMEDYVNNVDLVADENAADLPDVWKDVEVSEATEGIFDGGNSADVSKKGSVQSEMKFNGGTGKDLIVVEENNRSDEVSLMSSSASLDNASSQSLTTSQQLIAKDILAPTGQDLSTTPQLKEDSDGELDAQAFELLINSNVEKYRQKRNNQYEYLDLFGPQTSPLKYRSPANPLRLLYSSSNLENSDMLQSATTTTAEEADAFHSPFVLSKSIATVSETPLTSLHKKLRINALPMKYSSPLSAKTCECASSQQSPAIRALAATLLKEAPQGTRDEEDELWSSSGLYTETEELESDQVLWTNSSDSDSSSDSQDDSTNNTNNIYLSFKKDLDSKRKRQRAKRKTRLVFRNETSPTPKHQPSHRTLKPKQSILKIKSIVAKSVGLSVTPSASTDHFQQEIYLETPYRSSPRGSFVNCFSAIGEILQSNEQKESGSEDGDLEDDDNSEGSITAKDRERGITNHDESKTVSKLRRLLI